MAPNSFTIARALRTTVSNLRALEGKRPCFSIRAQKAKLTANFLTFPSVKFPKIWQTGSKYISIKIFVYSNTFASVLYKHDLGKSGTRNKLGNDSPSALDFILVQHLAWQNLNHIKKRNP